MRLRHLLASTGPVLLALTGCTTTDLPAPTNFEILEPPPPPNELVLGCETIPLTANGAMFSYTPEVSGLIDEVSYVYSAEGLPDGLEIDAGSGQISGTVTADPGSYTFEITIEETDVEREPYSARTECILEVNARLSAPLTIDTVALGDDPYCLRPGDSLREFVATGTGDGSAITCAFRGGKGNGRLPQGVEVDPDTCTLTGSIDEDRYGTWVFIMEGQQSGASVHVPYCVTNDVAQGYEITADHSGETDVALTPIVRTYDPTASFFIVADREDPRVNVVSPESCVDSCFYRYSFQRTAAPIDDATYTLEPDGLIRDDMMNPLGFFHELRVAGPAVPEEFRERPWVLSSAISYCITDDEGGCADPAADGDAAFELSLIMVPDPG